MIYPSFLNKGDTIGICAPSAGVGRKPESFDLSLQVLREQGYQVQETKSVRLDSDRGGTARERGQELNSLFADEDVKMVMAASGGDFLDEMLPYADFELMKSHPKWLVGASDPTGLLFPYTTLYDVATLYGANAGSYDLLKDLEEHRAGSGDQPAAAPEGRFLTDSLAFLRGELPVQITSEKHLGCAPFLAEQIRFDTPTEWRCSSPALHVTGRCIGGCIDVLKDLIGTPYGGAVPFVKRYGERDGIIWYFDNFALSAEVLYRTLLQMKYAGWFENTRAILLGRTLFEKSESGMTYDDAAKLAFGGHDGGAVIPVIREADIGHTIPHMTMINGAMLELTYEGGRGSLKYSLR